MRHKLSFLGLRSLIIVGSVLALFSTAAKIYWAQDPFNFRAPSDLALIKTFQDHRLAFEEVRGTTSVDLKLTVPEDGSYDHLKQDANPGQRVTELTSRIPGLIAIGKDYDGTLRLIFAQGKLLAVGSGWAKGIEYVPGSYGAKGDLKTDLDKARTWPPGVYLREIEPHWCVLYQRDD